MRHPLSSVLTLLVAFLGWSLLTGCSDSLTGIDETNALRSSPGNEAQAPVTLRMTALNTSAAKMTSALTIEEAKILLKTIKFTPLVESDTSRAFKTGMIAVTLDPNGPAHDIAVGSVPPNTYRRVTFKIHKPEDHETPPDPDFKEGTSGDQRFSVIVRGTKDGQPFTLKIRKPMQQRVALDPPLVITDSTSSVTVTLATDLGAWFIDEDGHMLDPLNPEDLDDIADAIKDSFRAESHVENGRRDDHGDQGEDHGDQGEDHGDQGEDHGDQGEDHGDQGEDHGDHGEDHGDHGENHGDQGEDHGEVELEGHLQATDADSLASGKAKFEEKNDHAHFSTEVEDVSTDGTGEVVVWRDGTEVLRAPIDIIGGFGDLNLDSQYGDAVPAMAEGDLVEVYNGDGVLILAGSLKRDD